MRAWIVLLLMSVFAGCAEELPEIVDEEPAVALQGFLVDVALPQNLTAGVFNVTFAGPANATWMADFTQGNDTVSASGATLPANATFEALPGNATLTLVAELAGHEPFNLTLPLNFTAVAEAIVIDPCAGVAAQEPFEFSGILYGAAGAPATAEHAFDVGPCQTGFVGAISYLPTGLDMDVDIYDPSGAAAGGAASFGIGEENDVAVEGSPFLAEGTWLVVITPFASGPTTYDYTITFD